jgi:serine/threonine protein kinase
MLAPNGNYDGAVDMWSVGCILGELIQRKPMFPGTDFMDQLTRVFKVIPVPVKEKRGYHIERDALKFLSSLPPALPGALEKLCRTAGPNALDLIKKLLCFNPKERITADQALAHPFFDGVQEEWGEIAALKLSHSLEFAFEHQSLPLSTLRQYICEEVLAFRDRDRREAQEKQTKAAQKEFPVKSEEKRVAQPQQPQYEINGSTDCPAGSGFTLKACEFNVSSSYKPLQVLGEGSYGIVW